MIPCFWDLGCGDWFSLLVKFFWWTRLGWVLSCLAGWALMLAFWIRVFRRVDII